MRAAPGILDLQMIQCQAAALLFICGGDGFLAPGTRLQVTRQPARVISLPQ